MDAILHTPYKSALLITWGRGVMRHSALLFIEIGRRRLFSNLLPLPCPRVLMIVLFLWLFCFFLAFLCPHLYWADYFYVANVLNVFFISLFCYQFSDLAYYN